MRHVGRCEAVMMTRFTAGGPQPPLRPAEVMLHIFSSLLQLQPFPSHHRLSIYFYSTFKKAGVHQSASHEADSNEWQQKQLINRFSYSYSYSYIAHMQTGWKSELIRFKGGTGECLND